METKSCEMQRTHKGLFAGLAPIWLDMSEPECPAIEARGGLVGELWLDIAEGMFGVFCTLATMVNSEFEPVFPIRITGTCPNGQ